MEGNSRRIENHAKRCTRIKVHFSLSNSNKKSFILYWLCNHYSYTERVIKMKVWIHWIKTLKKIKSMKIKFLSSIVILGIVLLQVFCSSCSGKKEQTTKDDNVDWWMGNSRRKWDGYVAKKRLWPATFRPTVSLHSPGNNASSKAHYWRKGTIWGGSLWWNEDHKSGWDKNYIWCFQHLWLESLNLKKCVV